MKQLLSFLTLLQLSPECSGQDSSRQPGIPLSLGVHMEVYYSYDFNNPADNDRPDFIYGYNRHNEFNVNLAYFRTCYQGDDVRANLALAAGTYINANYAAEPGVLKNLYEANAGVKLLRNRNLWIDAGIMPSHIGFESAHGPSCWTLTRSIISDNSPYYETGARLSYTSNSDQWMVALLAFNGWQRIQRLPGNSVISWGAQLQYKPNSNILFNYSNFFGSDRPDSSREWRHFHNFYGTFRLSGLVGLILGIDVGQQQAAKGSKAWDTWYGAAAILRYTPTEKWALALRGEYYQDKQGVIISPGKFSTFGLSLNLDRMINKYCMWRTEVRTLTSSEPVFLVPGKATYSTTAVTISLAFTLN